MIIIRSCCCWSGLVAACLSATSAAAAPEASFGEDAYGHGVQAYFSGNSGEADQLLMEATGQDPQDPRPYYFHGLCLLRQGRVDEARSDFIVAAALEASSRRSYPVGKSLERVQGGDRLMLEQYRWRAQPAGPAPNLVAPIDSSRRGTIAIPSDAGVLRQAATVPLDKLTHPVSLADLTSRSEVAPTPIAPAITNESAPPAARGTVGHADAPPATSDPAENPFGDDQQASPDKKIPSGKLLGIVGRAIIEAAPLPSVESLRDQLPTLPIPTGGAPTTQADANTDSDATIAPAEEDPFFESTPAPAETQPSEPAPAAEEDDPFG